MITAALALAALIVPADHVRITIEPGANPARLVRALDPHFACLELAPTKAGGYILRDCDPRRPTPKGIFRVHAR
jgi:hypothetical protein